MSRRRFRGKGWHIDIGPGFPTDNKRTSAGHRYQGLVVLLLLSDWLPGGGGTAIVPGSHNWVGDMFSSHGDSAEDDDDGGIVHQNLNAMCVDRMLGAIRNQTLIIEQQQEKKDHHYQQQEEEQEKQEKMAENMHTNILLEQIVGNAGDVVLMHPWLIHSGTTNLRSVPRLLANGMVRIKQAVFNEFGHPLLFKKQENKRKRMPGDDDDETLGALFLSTKASRCK